MMVKISERAIRAMPYHIREEHYNKEKNEMLKNNLGASPRELQRLLDELIKKWGV